MRILGVAVALVSASAQGDQDLRQRTLIDERMLSITRACQAKTNVGLKRPDVVRAQPRFTTFFHVEMQGGSSRYCSSVPKFAACFG